MNPAAQALDLVRNEPYPIHGRVEGGDIILGRSEHVRQVWPWPCLGVEPAKGMTGMLVNAPKLEMLDL